MGLEVALFFQVRTFYMYCSNNILLRYAVFVGLRLHVNTQENFKNILEEPWNIFREFSNMIQMTYFRKR